MVKVYHRWRIGVLGLWVVSGIAVLTVVVLIILRTLGR